ncbi:MAG TPA: hypothetical protein VD931_03695 [Baekduia sp.]|nr:hypothetical protein [Baekduia sp.]
MTRDLSTATDAELDAAVDGRLGDPIDPFAAISEIERRHAERDAEIRRLVEVERLGRPAIAERLGLTQHAVRVAMLRMGLQRPEPRSEWLTIRLTPSEHEAIVEAAGDEDPSTRARDVLLAWAERG